MTKIQSVWQSTIIYNMWGGLRDPASLLSLAAIASSYLSNVLHIRALVVFFQGPFQIDFELFLGGLYRGHGIGRKDGHISNRCHVRNSELGIRLPARLPACVQWGANANIISVHIHCRLLEIESDEALALPKYTHCR